MERGGSANTSGRFNNKINQDAILRVNAFKPCDNHLNG